MDLYAWERLNSRLDNIETTQANIMAALAKHTDLLTDVIRQGVQFMAAMDDLEQRFDALETVEAKHQALLDAIAQELNDMLTTGATPARIQALKDKMDAMSARVQSDIDTHPDPGAPGPQPGP